MIRSTTSPRPINHFATLTQYHQYMNWQPPCHSLISLLSGARDYHDLLQIPISSDVISTDFYIMKMVDFRANHMTYGRGDYDFNSGSLVLMAPQQSISWHNVNWAKEIHENTFILMVHQDFFLGTPLQALLNDYGFFEYYVNEALHVDATEQRILIEIFSLIEQEYHADYPHSESIIVSLIHLLLQYADRFYQRQFSSRQHYKGHLLPRFKQCLNDYYNSFQKSESPSLPTVAMIAKELALSPRYLNDALKWENGLTAQDSIHQFILDKAKSYLLEPNSQVAQVAYRLGFEYPQYFSRLFKQKLKMSPSEFQRQHATQKTMGKDANRQR